jgi:hypothetical protein
MLEAAVHALRLVDAGDCGSGGDYHSSRVGRHCDANGGKLTCPACVLRAAITKATGVQA